MSTFNILFVAILAVGQADLFEALGKEEVRHGTVVPSTGDSDARESAAAPEQPLPPELIPADRKPDARSETSPSTDHGNAGAATALLPQSKTVAAVNSRVDRPERNWRVSVAAGMAMPHSSSSKWFGSEPQPTMHLRLDRKLERLLPGASFTASGDIWTGDQLISFQQLRMGIFEAAVGAQWQWPADGFRGWLFPYLRATATIAYVRLRSGESFGGDSIMPGLSGALGARATLGKSNSPSRFRFLLFADGGYAARLPRTVNLHRLEDDKEGPALPGPSVRLGSLNLSGFEWRAGAGMTF